VYRLRLNDNPGNSVGKSNYPSAPRQTQGDKLPAAGKNTWSWRRGVKRFEHQTTTDGGTGSKIPHGSCQPIEGGDTSQKSRAPGEKVKKKDGRSARAWAKNVLRGSHSVGTYRGWV